MSDKYVMNADGTVRLEPDLMAWGRAFKNDRTVGHDFVCGQRVSTVFLRLDHGFGNGPPVLFETMIFGGAHNEKMWRYSTRDEALDGHARVVLALKKGETP